MFVDTFVMHVDTILYEGVGLPTPSYKIVKGTKYWSAYRLYFGMDIGNQDKSWAPHVICGGC